MNYLTFVTSISSNQQLAAPMYDWIKRLKKEDLDYVSISFEFKKFLISSHSNLNFSLLSSFVLLPLR